MPAHSTAEGRREEWTAAENGFRIALEANIGDVCRQGEGEMYAVDAAGSWMHRSLDYIIIVTPCSI